MQLWILCKCACYASWCIPLICGVWLEQAHCDGVASVVVVAGYMDEAVEPAAVWTDMVAVVYIGDGDSDGDGGEIPI